MLYLPTGRPDMTPPRPGLLPTSGAYPPGRIAKETPSRRLGSISALSALLAANSGGGHDLVVARHQDDAPQAFRCPQEGHGGA